MTKLSEMPFEYRIRVKYTMFGILLGITGFAIIMFSSGITAYIFRVYHINQPIDLIIESWILSQLGIQIAFLLFIPLLYWMWNSKSKMKNHPELENIGLKWDWEQVKRA